MSLLGRLEDLPLTDIIQIVFLSRRTGMLEITNSNGRHTVLFRQGLVINASAPDHPDLTTHLVQRGLVSSDAMTFIRKMQESEVPVGTAVLDLNLVSKETLAKAIRDRILAIFRGLQQSREGEFNFLLIDSLSGMDIEYEPDLVLKDRGFPPNKILDAPDGEKLKPLRGLEESIRAGKAFLRSAAEAASLELPATNVVPFHSAAVQAAPAPPPTEMVPPDTSDLADDFNVVGGLVEPEMPTSSYRNVIVCERNPLIRVAAKRAFLNNNVRIGQFGSADDAWGAITDLFRTNRMFVTFLELTPDGAAQRLLEQIKRRNPLLPVVIIDHQTDLRRRHDVLRSGANFYLTKPPPERLQPGLAEEELALFADELVLFAKRSLQEWERLTGSVGVDAGKHSYEIADKQNLDRSFALLKQLINELSSPNDITQVVTTILRLASQYLDRGALFIVRNDTFAGVSGFGVTGSGEDMAVRVGKIGIPRREQSILSDVVDTGHVHRGKIRRTAANVRIIEAMGDLLPTEVIVLPITHNEQLVGILYGDNAEHRAAIDTPSGLEIFLSQAGYALRNALLASTSREPEGGA